MTTHRALPIACALLISALVAGCGNSDTTASATGEATTTTTAMAASPAPSVSDAPLAALDATTVAQTIKAAVSTATQIVTITEDNDPNAKIGRPGGYISAAVIYDSGLTCTDLGATCGATLEEWPDEAAARDRAAYIQQALMDNPVLGTEWDDVVGGMLLRIPGEQKPSVAQEYAAAFGGTNVSAP